MRNVSLFLGILVFLLPSSRAFAFNSAKWMVKREAAKADAVRLRAAYSNCVSRISSPSVGITIPLELNSDGSIRTSLHAGRAQFFLDSPFVWAEELTLVKMDDDGTEKLRLVAGSCVIDREVRSGWVEGRAKVTLNATTFEGDGVYFSATNGYVSVSSGADMKSADLKFGGL